MTLPTPDQFDDFYSALYSKVPFPVSSPFPWQTRIAKRVCAGEWPSAIALPTAAGKTACLDVAVFALACRAEGATRRIFFVVDRRIVVDQAYHHAKKIAAKLDRAEAGVLRAAADSLRTTADEDWGKLTEEDRQSFLEVKWRILDEPDAEKRLKIVEKLNLAQRRWVELHPLDVYALRGGMYRESAWARSPLQPTILASTVDQVGSRLLFRGYGVSDAMKPIHAGLVGNDSIILLDEAHCAKPFEQTVRAVQGYRDWVEGPKPAFRFVSITATPVGEGDVMRDDEADRKHPVLGKRIDAKKPATLVVAEQARGKNFTPQLVKALEKEAKDRAVEGGCVGIIVNRVKTARDLKAKLGDDAVLLTGRMRPLDRDAIMQGPLQSLLSGVGGTPPKFVIGTQCLEVGADFDFHALVTECASLDALRQRFGRLNRIAARPIASAAVVIRGDQTEDTTEDPVYGESLANTWKWLKEKAPLGIFDFGIAAVRVALDDADTQPLNAPTADAPVLFPAHLDCWVQTNPIPTPDPDPALFLHGPKKPGQPDVQLVFRSDLGKQPYKWVDVVSLCPPSSSEAVAVPIGLFKRWLANESMDDATGDTEGEMSIEDDDLKPAARFALCWQGEEDSQVVTDPANVRPTKTYVVPSDADVLAKLFDYPNPSSPPEDFAEQAYQRSRDKVLLRLLNVALTEEMEKPEEDAAVNEAIAKLAEGQLPEWQRRAVDYFVKYPKARDVSRHPNGGVVVTGKRRLHQFDPTYLEDSEPSSSFYGRPITLKAHSYGVAEYAVRYANGCKLDIELYRLAGLYHDLGKLDPRFQRLLKGFAAGTPFAKSGNFLKRDWAVHQYPKGARHELLSAAIVAQHTSDDLLLHLITTHHGMARPFADPVAENDAAKPIAAEFFGLTAELASSKQDIAGWNAELPERFWRIVRKYGWWGAAYLETVFRLADHSQSRDEQEKELPPAGATVVPAKLQPPAEKLPTFELPLPGLDGANPLGFLAALGTLRLADQKYPGEAKLRWEKRGLWLPILQLPEETTGDELINLLQKAANPKRRCIEFAPDVKIQSAEYRVHEIEAASAAKEGREFSDFIRAYADPLVTIQGGPNAGRTKPTEFYFIAGRQRLLDIVRAVATATTVEHLRKCLFELWRYDDPVEATSMRWDPSDDSRYATRWRNPSGDPIRKKRGSVLGANRLAFEALPFFPCFVRKERLATTGFVVEKRRPFFRWPLWTTAWGIDTVRSALSTGGSSAASIQLAMPVWYQSEKVENSDYSNFAPTQVI